MMKHTVHPTETISSKVFPNLVTDEHDQCLTMAILEGMALRECGLSVDQIWLHREPCSDNEDTKFENSGGDVG